ncbi:Yip1 domain-containing protein [Chryseobacterium arachidis]|uniref:Yip1 domain-containing protein n=1 Tax=Chryseobacterium arachidis TaxID=1416778 RepID=A0A1M5LWL8_9FLAO|nr:YIP1 family protein [Chryseobacterium arachidis]SHG68763.1 Yip1 domain-containing protein [Chryseobacterium arachidis]
MNWRTIFNPFSKYNEKQLLLAGIIGLIITLGLCQLFGFQVDSIFHYRYTDEKTSIITSIGLSILSYAIPTVIFFILGKIYNKRTRLIDIINTVLISQIPGILIILLSEIPLVKSTMDSIAATAQKNPEGILAFDLITMCIYSFSLLILIVYGMTLFYNGFKTATNFKDWKQIVLFAFILLATCITSQFYTF